MTEVSLVRLHLLRIFYAVIAVGLGIQIFPGILRHPMDLALMRGVARSLLGAIALLSLVGIRYPLKMLPLLLFELAWKSIWVLAFFLPLYLAHRVDADTWDTFTACM